MRALWLLISLLPALAFAQGPEIQAILGEKAVVQYNGKRLVLGPGESSNGVKLLTIRGDKVVLEVNGARGDYRLGERRSLSTQFRPPTEAPSLTLHADQKGMYRTSAKINGQDIKVLVDTGATYIALNSRHARQLGLDYRRLGKEVMMSTASQVEKGYLMKLSRVKVGTIELYDVEAVVMDNKLFPDIALLGMSFLSRLEMTRSGSALILRKGL